MDQMAVLYNLNGDVIICTKEQAKEIQLKEALEILNNGFDCVTK